MLLWRQDDQWIGKVSDYGTAKFMQQTMTVAPGAMIYSPPEALTSNQTVKVSFSHCLRLLTLTKELSDPYPNFFPCIISVVVSSFHCYRRSLLKSLPNNYRPISLTCISCKIMKHVLCSHLSNHLEINNILTPHQHGFRKGFSTETQLIAVLDDWLSSLDKQTRTDVLLVDFSKAFDSVSHQRLLLKLNYYGITGNSLSWIENFVLDRTQCVLVSGTRSSWISVTSGVPQGTVLGLLLFLIYINDIAHNLNTKIKLFADDAVFYSEVSNVHDMTRP